MRPLQLDLDGSALIDSLSLVARGLGEKSEIRVDDSWLAHHGCCVKPYERFRETLERELDAAGAGRRALSERRTLRVVLAVAGKPLLLADLDVTNVERCVRFTRPPER